MNKFYEYKFEYNRISFTLTDKSSFDEREIHPYHEILFLTDANGCLLTKNGSTELKNNVLIVIPKENYHFLKLQEGYFNRLKIAFPQIQELDDLAFASNEVCVIDRIGETALFLLKKICELLATGNMKTAKHGIYGTFLMLLYELSRTIRAEVKITASPVITECIKLINDGSKNIKVEDIAKKLNVSVSTLTHTFKKEMGIPVHKYIQQKRLILAKRLIEAGNKPTKIYTDCGFEEYSTFYRAYCKMFGTSPSGTILP